MILPRYSKDRGHFNHGWLNTYHTFSFGEYYDEAHMSFRSLRVLNEDWVAGGKGFPTHPHRDMEIVTYVLEGALEHKDSLGTGSIIKPGEVQRMSAGTGIMHSEANASATEKVHLLQIWIMPERKGLTPGYEQKKFSISENKNNLVLVASPTQAHGSVKIHQDVNIFAAQFESGNEAKIDIAAGRHGWLQLAKGRIKVNDQEFDAGDGVAVSDEKQLTLQILNNAEFLWFDLA